MFRDIVLETARWAACTTETFRRNVSTRGHGGPPPRDGLVGEGFALLLAARGCRTVVNRRHAVASARLLSRMRSAASASALEMLSGGDMRMTLA